MKEVTGDLWELARSTDAVVITTNGEVHWDGQAVMGAGCALEAAQRYPWLPMKLAERIKVSGNIPHLFHVSPEQGMRMALVTFPTKNAWKEKSNLELIAASAFALVNMTDGYTWKSVVLPRPGCGYGRLEWETVRPLLADILDDRFTVTTK